MSNIRPQGGAVPTGDASVFFNDPSSGFDCSLSLRITNATANPVVYTSFVIDDTNNSRDSRCIVTVPASSYLDIEAGLKLPPTSQLSHSASVADALYWSLTGVQDDEQ